MNSLTASNLDAWEYWENQLAPSLPAWARKPTPGAYHELAAVEKVAAALGTPLLPWQRYVARVITEHDQVTGEYRYRRVVLTVPRQSGKTTLIRALFLTRILKRRNVAYAIYAQTGKDARDRLMDLADLAEQTPFGKRLKVNRGQTNPAIHMVRNHSKVISLAPTEIAGHGGTYNGALIDEAFSFTEEQAARVLGAIVPAMTTKRDQQTIIVSTKGTMRSVWLNGLVDEGRESVSDPESGTAYFEWSLSPDLDPMNPENWEFHPGYGGGLTTRGAISSAAETMTRTEFIRAYMNLTTVTNENLLAPDTWRAQAGTITPPAAHNICYGYEVAKDGTRAAIVAAWSDGEKTAVRLIESRPGTDWLQPYLLQLAATRPRAITADRWQQNTVIHDRILTSSRAWEKTFSTLTAAEYSTACAAFLQRFEDRTLTHENQERLNGAILTAATSTMGRDSWKFSHESAPEFIALVAAVRAADTHATRRTWIDPNS